MTYHIRKENPDDLDQIIEITNLAFAGQKFSDGKEGELVLNLHKNENFIADLSLVAELGHAILGHILFTPIRIENGTSSHVSLALAPVSVKPAFQRIGIGTALILQGHKIASELGYNSVIVLGHPKYYPRFGYKVASSWGIVPPFDVIDQFFMAKELKLFALKSVSGIVVYPKEFA
jgi:predicted N-acetyltransferase YhbS